MQYIVHYFLHLVLPYFIARLFFKSNWQRAYGLMLLTMLIDLDHLLASPVMQVNRCSICYHPLHSVYAMVVYGILLFFKGDWRILGIGFMMHMATDFIDCIFIYSNFPSYSINGNILKLFHYFQ